MTLKSYKLGILDFDTFATKQFFLVARSGRVFEKFNKNHQKSPVSYGSERIAQQISLLKRARDL